MGSFSLPALPDACERLNSPAEWKAWGADKLAVVSGGKTDWFIDPAGGSVAFSAPAALFAPPDESRLLSAKVSVVTRGASDDCNSTPIEGIEVHLGIALMRKSLVFRCSLDGRQWNFVRNFCLGAVPGGVHRHTLRGGELKDLGNGE